jgi:signal transduction histidine kinase
VDERTRALKESNERLESVDESRRKLLADISHEFRTPLTVIRGEAEIAMRGKDRPAGEYRETLERIMEQADQTTRLIDDLLFIARADAGEPRLKVRTVALDEVIEAVRADFAAEAQRREIEIHTTLDDEPLTVAGDDGRLRQVFAIVVDNALRYSNPGGAIEIATRRRDDTIVVTVSDNGIGISEEEAAQVFQRFYRGGKAQAHARGTGLGLPVARAIVEAHEGTIEIEGQPDEGTVVTVTLPAGGTLKAVA